MKNIRILRIIDILAVELGDLRNMLESACRAFDEGKVKRLHYPKASTKVK